MGLLSRHFHLFLREYCMDLAIFRWLASVSKCKCILRKRFQIWRYKNLR